MADLDSVQFVRNLANRPTAVHAPKTRRAGRYRVITREEIVGGAVALGPGTIAAMARWLPGIATLLGYRREWLRHDVVAGMVLAALLVPRGWRTRSSPACPQ